MEKVVFEDHSSRVCWSSFKGLQVSAVILFLALSLSCFAADDPYLDVLEAESGKVEQGVDEATTRKSNSELAVQRAAFETLLEEGYRGTHVFYKRLSERSKQEVFLRYSQGASMADVRDMIISRSK